MLTETLAKSPSDPLDIHTDYLMKCLTCIQNPAPYHLNAIPFIYQIITAGMGEMLTAFGSFASPALGLDKT
jgi:hypothetical protein